MFPARYGLIPYIKRITFSLSEVNAISSSIPNKADNVHITVRSRDDFCCRKVISIKYSECVCQ